MSSSTFLYIRPDLAGKQEFFYNIFEYDLSKACAQSGSEASGRIDLRILREEPGTKLVLLW